MTEYHSIHSLLDLCKEQEKQVWEVVQQADMEESGATEKQVFEKMRFMYKAMQQADKDYEADLKSQSGMVGGDGEKMRQFNASGKNLCSEYSGLAMEKALKMGESNACMKRIVAAPTAGSCGVIPAVLLSYEESKNTEEDELVKALFVASGIGKVVAENASIAGAFGGCQAEIGTASAMAAGALAYLQGADNEQIMQAATFALKNMLGLACDPVGGLVEVPCVKRNVAGVVNAISSAQLALAGITSVITPDDTIDSMRRIGNDLPSCLKETSKGGLAVTESAKRIHDLFFWYKLRIFQNVFQSNAVEKVVYHRTKLFPHRQGTALTCSWTGIRIFHQAGNRSKTSFGYFKNLANAVLGRSTGELVAAAFTSKTF